MSRVLTFLCGNMLSNCKHVGWGSTNEDAKHGEVPTHRHGHGTPHGEEESEQLESPLPLVTMEAALWYGT